MTDPMVTPRRWADKEELREKYPDAPSGRLAIATAVLLPASTLIQRCMLSWAATSSDFQSCEFISRENTVEDNLGVTGSLQFLYEHSFAPIIAFLHSDVEIFEQGWDERVLREFDDPQVGVVGFGGALQLGENDIYRLPYKLTQLARVGYLSAQRDWQTHGEFTKGSLDVATLDGFALIVRRELLDKWGGWPVERYPFHNYDNMLCLHAHKVGWRVRLVGVDCIHHGGSTSTTEQAQAHWKAQGTSDVAIHEQSHLNLYEDGRGWLPLRRFKA